MEDRSDGRRPPLRAAVRCRHLVSGEASRDLSEASAAGAFGSDSFNDVGLDGCPAPGPCPRLRFPTSWAATLRQDPLELVDGNEPRPPRHFDRLDQRQDAAVEGRAADAERLRSLRARVGEPLNTRRFSNDCGPRRS
jgi:hypothetical protein